MELETVQVEKKQAELLQLKAEVFDLSMECRNFQKAIEQRMQIIAEREKQITELQGAN